MRPLDVILCLALAPTYHRTDAAVVATAALHLPEIVPFLGMAAGSLAVFAVYVGYTLKFERLLTTPDMHKDFADFVHRATPSNLGGAERRYEQGQTALSVSDALGAAMQMAVAADLREDHLEPL